MITDTQFIDLLKREVKPALGCTEPVAVALAVARSAEEIRKTGEQPTKITVEVSRNILKNGMGVGIPGTGMVGLHVASAVALICGKSELGLEVLRNICPAAVEGAKELLSKNLVEIKLADTDEKLYISAICHSSSHQARTLIKYCHDRIVSVELDGKSVLCNAENPQCDAQPEIEEIKPSIREIYDFAQKVDFEKIRFILDAATLNRKIADEGLKNEYGLQVGRTIYARMGGDVFGNGLFAYSIALTAAASDARMAGSTMAVMSNSGSGNQGITATMPVVAAAEKYNSTEEQLARALIMSHLTAIHIKQNLGRLSALCGCVVASTGSACGIVMLSGGGYEQMAAAIKNMVGNITGMVCDGAKIGCALKVASGVGAAVQSAVLAMSGISATHNDGIIDNDVEKTLVNLSSIGTEGMQFTDRLMLDIMANKRPV